MSQRQDSAIDRSNQGARTPSRRRLVFAAAAVLVVVAVGIVAVVASRGQRGASVYTDGAKIRVSAGGAPLRSILWEPAEPVKSAGGWNGTARGLTQGGDDEYEPRVSSDGTTMVFVRGRPGHNADLYRSRLTPSGWTAPEAITSINTESDELGPELSRDGARLYFYSDRAGGLGGYDLWVARRDESAGRAAWLAPTNLGPAVNTTHNEYGPALTPDGSRLFFASNRPGAGEPEPAREAWSATIRESRSRHDYDLFESRIDAGAGDEARDAHPIAPLNTAQDEGAPAVSPAGDFLYFASDRSGGLGGFDVYRVRLKPGGFGEIENAGAAINSSSDDMDPALSADGFRLYFSTNRPGVHEASGAAETAAGAGPRLFELWGSVSREVYLDEEPASRPSIADLLGDMWPWLLLLLLLAMLLYLLGRLARSAVWRRRFGRLSLLGQCLLLSLALHLILAGLLALWRVGNEISEYLRQAGGHRVILASAGPAGEAAAQIRGAFVSEELPRPVEMDVARPDAPAVQSSIASEHVDLNAAIQAPALSALQTSLSVTKPMPGAASEPAASSAPASDPSLVSSPAMPSAAAPDAARAEAVVGVVRPTLEPSAPSVVDVGTLTGLLGDVRVEPLMRPSVSVEAPRPSDAIARRVGDTSAATGSPATEPARLLNVESVTHQTASAISLPSVMGPADSTKEASIESRLNGPGEGVVSAVRAEVDARGSESAARMTTAVSERSVQESQSASNSVGSRVLRPASPSVPSVAADVSAFGAAPPAEAGSRVALPSRAERDAEPTHEPMIEARGIRAAPSGDGAGGPIGLDAISKPSDPPMESMRVDTSPPPASVAGTGAAAGITSPLGGSVRSGPETLPALDRSALANRVPGRVSRSVSPAIPKPAGTRDAVEEPASSARPGASMAVPALPERASVVMDSGGGAADASRVESPGVGTLTSVDAGGAALARAGAPTGRPESGAIGGVPALSLGAPARDGRADALSASRGARLPVEEAPVQPKESFEQRAPEVRAELLEKMGGNEETEKAVGLALNWFVAHQQPSGCWSGRHFDDGCGRCGTPSEFDSDGATTGIVLLCFLGAGHTHTAEGPYRDHVARAIDWLLARQAPSGDVRHDETMYSQTVATVALCEALAMTRDQRLAGPTRRAVAFLEANWNTRGRSDSRSSDDTAVLGWQVMAMESARRAGIDVSGATFEAARQWLDYVADARQPGRYSYRRGEQPTPAMTAEAMFVRQLLGADRDERRMRQSAEFILSSIPRWNTQPGVTRRSPNDSGDAQTYYWYYATLALFQHQGDEWKRWNEALVPALLGNQHQTGPAAGSWDPQDPWSRMGGRLYQTAICTLSLEVYYRYKPAGVERAGRRSSASPR
ncbi:MAG: hypothetical protein AB7G11_00380 [Phycisphaerales bacterium]